MWYALCNSSMETSHVAGPSSDDAAVFNSHISPSSCIIWRMHEGLPPSIISNLMVCLCVNLGHCWFFNMPSPPHLSLRHLELLAWYALVQFDRWNRASKIETRCPKDTQTPLWLILCLGCMQNHIKLGGFGTLREWTAGLVYSTRYNKINCSIKHKVTLLSANKDWQQVNNDDRTICSIIIFHFTYYGPMQFHVKLSGILFTILLKMKHFCEWNIFNKTESHTSLYCKG